MTKAKWNFLALCSLLLVLIGSDSQAYWSPTEPIGRSEFTFSAVNPDHVLEKTAAKPKSIFRRYRPVLDSKTKIISPLQVTGTESNPTIQMTVRKCIFIKCETIALDASINIREVSGSCRQNYVLQADLRRSSEILSHNYESLFVNICYQAARQNGNIKAEAFAVRAPTHSDGIIAKEILKMLKMQIPAMTKALEESLEANGARRR